MSSPRITQEPKSNVHTAMTPHNRSRKGGYSAPQPAANLVVPVPHARHTAQSGLPAITTTRPGAVAEEVASPAALREQQVAVMQQKLKALAASRKLQQHFAPLVASGAGASDSAESALTNRAGHGSRASTVTQRLTAQTRSSLDEHEAEIRVSLLRLENPWIALEAERPEGRVKRRERAFSRCHRLLTPSALGLFDGSALLSPAPHQDLRLPQAPVGNASTRSPEGADGAALPGPPAEQLASWMWERASREVGVIESLWRSTRRHEHFSILDAALAAGHEHSVRRRTARLMFDVTSVEPAAAVDWSAAAAPSPVLATSTPLDRSRWSRLSPTPDEESRYADDDMRDGRQPAGSLLQNTNDEAAGRQEANDPDAVGLLPTNSNPQSPMSGRTLSRRTDRPHRQSILTTRSATPRPTTYAEKFARALSSAPAESAVAPEPRRRRQEETSSSKVEVDAAICFDSSARRFPKGDDGDVSQSGRVPAPHNQGPSKWLDDYVSMRLKYLNQQSSPASSSFSSVSTPVVHR